MAFSPDFSQRCAVLMIATAQTPGRQKVQLLEELSRHIEGRDKSNRWVCCCSSFLPVCVETIDELYAERTMIRSASPTAQDIPERFRRVVELSERHKARRVDRWRGAAWCAVARASRKAQFGIRNSGLGSNRRSRIAVRVVFGQTVTDARFQPDTGSAGTSLA